MPSGGRRDDVSVETASTGSDQRQESDQEKWETDASDNQSETSEQQQEGDDDSEQQQQEDDDSENQESSHQEEEEESENNNNNDQDEDENQEEEEEEEESEESRHIATLVCLSDTPLEEDQDWKNVVIARVALWGEGGVRALLLQNKDGTESGSAHISVRDRDTVKQSVTDRWTLVEQPMGYITRIHGFHSIYGTPCLLHSARLEFASGQVMEFQGVRDDWKGAEFEVKNLPDNFFVSALEFKEGVCIGYRGYSTPAPLAEMFEDESQPDLDFLQQQDDYEENEKKRKNSRDKNNDNDKEPGEDNPYGKQETGGWVGDHLKARELPYPDYRDSMMLAYVCLLGKDALQGAIFLFFDGHREGKLSAVRKRGILCKGRKLETDIHVDVEQFENTLRGAQFVKIEQPGGRIRTISGRRLTRIMPSTTKEKGPKVTYLCHTLNLEFVSGQVIKFVGSNKDWKGDYFSYSIPPDYYINQLEFAPARIGSSNKGGYLVGVSGVRTYDDASDMDQPEIDNKSPPCYDKCCCCLP
ncbi:expressed unknown protein [Seminavis robusta]|uniref:Uncharacterized protein n=1 Tax=Seminavis robusta TaxID=568900 RepID=A0A9N8E9Y5_9STRA|nr:expressed unknown protein [Seminavis robusta]|eukprot:Sro658_g182750.1 n/a (527) ;mRNA; r:31403-32983